MNGIFQPLLDLLNKRRSREEREPLLSEAEKKAIIRLQKEDGWKPLMKLLDNRIHTIAEGILHDSDEGRLHFKRGHIWGLREVAQIPLNLERQGEDFDAYERRRSADPADVRRRQQIATYGSEFWSA